MSGDVTPAKGPGPKEAKEDLTITVSLAEYNQLKTQLADVMVRLAELERGQYLKVSGGGCGECAREQDQLAQKLYNRYNNGHMHS
jgi:hypothetical protein